MGEEVAEEEDPWIRVRGVSRLTEWFEKLSISFKEFYESSEYVDLRLICRDGHVWTHQFILALYSPFMKAMLEEKKEDDSVSISIASDFETKDLETFVDSLYIGGVPKDPKKFEIWKELAETFGILREKSSKSLREIITEKKFEVFTTDSGEIVVNIDCTRDQVKNAQNEICPNCFKKTLAHRVPIIDEPSSRVASSGNDSSGKSPPYVYRCCVESCADSRLLKNAYVFNKHAKVHKTASIDKDFVPSKKKIICPICLRLRLSHKVKAPATTSENCKDQGKTKGSRYKCCQCKASKLSAKMFMIHTKNHIAKSFICPTCHKGFATEHTMKAHEVKKHGGGNNKETVVSTEVSNVVEVNTENAPHKQQLTSENAVQCGGCGSVMSQTFYENSHKNICDKLERNFSCKVCGQDGFFNAATLANHTRAKHSEERPFGCEYCPARYATSMALHGHRARKHNVNRAGEFVPKKMFPCAECGKMLTSRTKLAAHTASVHEKQRSWKCSFCGKSFSSKYNLMIHEGKKHTGNLPFACEVCQKGFGRKEEVNRHILESHRQPNQGTLILESKTS